MGKDLKGKEIGKGIHQLQNGTYEARYANRYGKRVSIYDRNLSRLRKRLDSEKKNDQNASVIQSGYTLSLWFSKWIDVHKYGVIRDSTKQSYVQVFENHIEPYLGFKKINEITNIDCKELIIRLNEQGLGFATQNRVRILLQDMFDKALVDDFMYRNPARGVRPVVSPEFERRVLSVDEQVTFFKTCSGTFYENLFVTAINTGLRVGELSGLFLDDVDYEKKLIHVNRTVLYQKLEGDDGKTYHIHDPKTRTSKRSIPMTRQCEKALKRQYMLRNVVMSQLRSKPLPGFERILFCTYMGTPLNATDVDGAIKKMLREINYMRDEADKFPPFSCHAFRHTFATRCFESGMNAKTVQVLLGHATLQMTMDLYTHVTNEQKQEEMMLLEKSLDEIDASSDSLEEQLYSNYVKGEYLSLRKIVPFVG